MGKAENLVTKQVREAISLRSCILLVRVQAGSFAMGDRFIRGAEPGAADLLGVYRGFAIAFEVKTAKGKLSPNQTAWAERWIEAGGIYRVVRSGMDAIAALDEIDRSHHGTHPALQQPTGMGAPSRC
jgi:hypothetical protein